MQDQTHTAGHTDSPSQDVPSGSGHKSAVPAPVGSALKRVRDLMDAGQEDEAVDELRRALQLYPGVAALWQAMGAAQYRNQAFPKAEEAFLKALELHPSAATYHGLGLARLASGRRDEALSSLRSAVSLDPGRWTSWVSIAEITECDEDRDTAIEAALEALQKSAEETPNNASLKRQYARLMVRLGRHADAIPWFEAALDRADDESAVLQSLAHAHAWSGDFTSAADYQKRSLETLKDHRLGAARTSYRVETAKEALLATKAALDAGGIDFFLVAGTLLGCVREGEPLAHDRDVDIGIRSEIPNGRIVAALRKDPGFVLPLAVSEGASYLPLSYQSVALDIFKHDRIDDAVWFGFSRRSGDIGWRLSAFQVEESVIFGERLRIPSPPERYLTELYGERWRTPDEAFSSVLSSPALVELSDEVRRFTILSRLRLALVRSDARRAECLRGLLTAEEHEPETGSKQTSDFQTTERFERWSAQK